MRILQQYTKGTRLFSEPGLTKGSRRAQAGIPWGVTVYYDPPVPCSAYGMDSRPTRLALTGTVGLRTTNILINTGATGCAYIGSAFCKQLGLPVQRTLPETRTQRRHAARRIRYLNSMNQSVDPTEFAPVAVSNEMQPITLADGSTTTPLGIVKVTVHCQQYRAELTCVVLDLTDEFDLILGDGWLSQHRAVIDYPRECVLLKHKTPPTVLRFAGSSPKTETPSLMTLSQVTRHLKQSQRAFLVVVRRGGDLPVGDEAEAKTQTEQPTKPPKSTASSIAKLDPKVLNDLLEEYKDLFPDSIPGLPPDRGISLSIPLIDGAQPVNRPAFRYSPAERQEIEEQVRYLLSRGLITERTSPFGAPVLFVPNPNGTLRVCIDYRGLNKLTRKNQFPIPRVDDLIDQLRGAKLFSAIDLMQGYYQIRIRQEDCEKTAFKTPIGLFEFKVLPFGLSNAPAIFQSMMNKIFAKQIGKSVLVYLDDIMVFSRSAEEHLKHLREVLDILREKQFVCRLHKCQFNLTEVKYLGHIVSHEGVRPNPAKSVKVNEWPTPTNVHEIRQFLGLANYFGKYMQGYSKMVTPLTSQTGAHKKFEWTQECQEAFEKVKYCLTHAPLLQMPNFDKPFEVVADASNTALGAVLLQDGHPIAFESKKFNAAELNYSTTEQELLASVHAVKVWRC